MTDKKIIDLPFVAFQGIQKVVTNLCCPFVAEKGKCAKIQPRDRRDLGKWVKCC